MTNLAEITNQASDRHKNNKCLTGTREGVPTNLKKNNENSKSSQNSKSLKQQQQETILEDERGKGAPKI